MQEVDKFKHLGIMISMMVVWGSKWLIGFFKEERYGG